MKIVIAGAGDVGLNISKYLSLEAKEITLIDINPEPLEHARQQLDLLTIQGDAASFQVLREAHVEKAKLVLAVTTSESTNLITAILAKKMGAKQVVARVQNPELLASKSREIFRELGIDSLFSPRLLAAFEIRRLLRQSSMTDLFEFEDGLITLLGILIDSSSSEEFQSLDPLRTNSYRILAVLRGHNTLLPGEGISLEKDDHLIVIATQPGVEELLRRFGKNPVRLRNVMILGGTEIGLKTAQLLENSFNVTIVDKDREKCRHLNEHLHKALIICADASHVDQLKEEGLDNMDAVVALTNNSEVNIIASLMANEVGVKKTIAQVTNADYVPLSRNIGVDVLINENLLAANNIFRFIRKGKVEAVTSVPGLDAEVIEYEIFKQNQLTRKKISELHLPSGAEIAAVIRNQKGLIPGPDFKLEKGDKAFVFSTSSAIPAVEKLFR
ncbi:MAG: Trk system potassium transporter TrkA [Saprospiraceae bacterium]|nr:Trk system potassium transporter TrkA [Saprospiraceae bacterium]